MSLRVHHLHASSEDLLINLLQRTHFQPIGDADVNKEELQKQAEAKVVQFIRDLFAQQHDDLFVQKVRASCLAPSMLGETAFSPTSPIGIPGSREEHKHGAAAFSNSLPSPRSLERQKRIAAVTNLLKQQHPRERRAPLVFKPGPVPSLAAEPLPSEAPEAGAMHDEELMFPIDLPKSDRPTRR